MASKTPLTAPPPSRLFRQTAERLALREDQIAQLVTYIDVLGKWQPKLNLIGPKTWADVWDRHVVDSLQCLRLSASLDQGAAPTERPAASGEAAPSSAVAPRDALVQPKPRHSSHSSHPSHSSNSSHSSHPSHSSHSSNSSDSSHSSNSGHSSHPSHPNQPTGSAGPDPRALPGRGWADIGTGAGFPGIVLSIATGIPVQLVESDQRKAAFQLAVKSATGAPFRVINKRVEALPAQPLDRLFARAFAPLPRLLDWCAPLIDPASQLILHKGRQAQDEIAEAQKTHRFEFESFPSLIDSDSVILRLRAVQSRR